MGAQYYILSWGLKSLAAPLVATCTNSQCHLFDAGLRFYQEHKSWIDALQHCHNENSTLVQITNQRVQDAVNSFLQNKSGLDGGVWIGLERSIFGVNVPWQWVSGEKVKEPHWSSSAFVDPLNNHCGKVIQVEGSQEFKWLDEDCHKELPFICQGKLLFGFPPILT